MATNTPNLKIPKPDGNEYFTRTAFNNIMDAIDQNAASKEEVKEVIKQSDPDLTYTASAVDEKGIYKVITYKRTDNTTYLISTLSSPDSNGYYKTCTWKFYDAAGTSITDTKTWTLTYDSKGNVISTTLA